ncbi:MAG: DUF2892 domain-containing protein [Alphaproteobacteria bacterium]|nr:DUF2892 domain-containing protein [Alphaproteobacteria bacterium]
MNANVGSLDRVVRVVLGLALVAWAIWGTDAWHMVGWAGLILIATAAISWCPIYRVIGASTCPAPAKR